jgi:hypothetical protein
VPPIILNCVEVIHWTGHWLGLRTNLDAVRKGNISCPCQKLNLDTSVFQPIIGFIIDGGIQEARVLGNVELYEISYRCQEGNAPAPTVCALCMPGRKRARTDGVCLVYARKIIVRGANLGWSEMVHLTNGVERACSGSEVLAFPDVFHQRNQHLQAQRV